MAGIYPTRITTRRSEVRILYRPFASYRPFRRKIACPQDLRVRDWRDRLSSSRIADPPEDMGADRVPPCGSTLKLQQKACEAARRTAISSKRALRRARDGSAWADYGQSALPVIPRTRVGQEDSQVECLVMDQQVGHLCSAPTACFELAAYLHGPPRAADHARGGEGRPRPWT